MTQQGEHTLVTRGFDAFSRGTCGHAGQNLYISRAGVLQRIFQFDLNRDGYLDLIFCNSQNHWERPPAYLYSDPLHAPHCRSPLPAEGARSGVVTDLTGDGSDDIVIANYYGGVTMRQNCSIYFGSPEGWSERYRQEVPAPMCSSVAAGDFAGDGRMDLAFLCDGKLKIFPQSELGFEPKRFIDMAIEGVQLAGEDVDGDGYGDLAVRSANGEVRIYWGGADGIHPDRFSVVPIPLDDKDPATSHAQRDVEYVEDAKPLVKVLVLDGTPHIYAAREDAAHLVPVIAASRQFGTPMAFACPRNFSVAAGDLLGQGQTDLVFACRDDHADEESSWIYWGSPNGFDASRRTPLATRQACDVTLGDFNGDGRDEIVICQAKREDTFTTESLIFRAASNAIDPDPVRLLSEDARRVLLARTSATSHPQLLVINHFSRGMNGDVDAEIYFGGPDGFSSDRSTGVPGFGAVESLCCDLNDDGFTDLVLANCSENARHLDPGSFIYFNGPNGFQREADIVLPTTRAHGVCCADLNRDGYLDLIFVGFSNDELLIFYGTPDGFDLDEPVRIRMEHEGTVYDDPRWIYLADLNNDGWLDLVIPQISYDRSLILWGGPEGFSMTRCQALSVFHAACARAADLNGNGYLDLVIAGHQPSEAEPHDAFVHIYWNGPGGLREDRRTLLPVRGANAMCLADFNGDGMLDLFVCSYHDVTSRDIDSYIYWNRKGRGFAAEDRRRLFTHSASGCVAADFNDNGYIDLAIAYHKVEGDHVGFSAVWWNGPDGFDAKAVTQLPTTGPHGMTCIETGNIADRGPEETYTSEPLQLPADATLAAIQWEADVPLRTWINAQIRTATSKTALTSTTWTGPDGPETRFAHGETINAAMTHGRWCQYRLALGADKAMRTPRVKEVAIYYRENES